jgi:hypothetical protein
MKKQLTIAFVTLALVAGASAQFTALTNTVYFTMPELDMDWEVHTNFAPRIILVQDFSYLYGNDYSGEYPVTTGIMHHAAAPETYTGSGMFRVSSTAEVFSTTITNVDEIVTCYTNQWPEYVVICFTNYTTNVTDVATHARVDYTVEAVPTLCGTNTCWETLITASLTNLPIADYNRMRGEGRIELTERWERVRTVRAHTRHGIAMKKQSRYYSMDPWEDADPWKLYFQEGTQWKSSPYGPPANTLPFGTDIEEFKTVWIVNEATKDSYGQVYIRRRGTTEWAFWDDDSMGWDWEYRFMPVSEEIEESHTVLASWL